MDCLVPSWVQLTTSQKEARRKEAAKLLLAGVPQVDVAKKFGVKPQTVFDWKTALEQEGMKGLDAVPKSGRPTKLTEAQRAKLETLLDAGPAAAGFDAQLWSGAEVRELIVREFDVEFHEKYVPRLLRNLGFRLRMPDREALEKDQAKKAAWRAATWEYSKKNSRKAVRSSSSTKRATR